MFVVIISKEVPYSSISLYTESLNAKVVSVIMMAPRLKVRRVETTLLGMREEVILIWIEISSCFPKR